MGSNAKSVRIRLIRDVLNVNRFGIARDSVRLMIGQVINRLVTR